MDANGTTFLGKVLAKQQKRNSPRILHFSGVEVTSQEDI